MFYIGRRMAATLQQKNPTESKTMRTKTTIFLLILATFLIIPETSKAQDCVECRPAVRLMGTSSTVVKRWQETEMVPVVRTYETREVFAEYKTRRQRGSVNWGCVASGVQAFLACNYSKRQARQQRRASGERVGLFSRLFSIFRNR